MWRVKSADFGPDGFVHLWDMRDHAHMVTELASGVVRLFIGHDDPNKSAIHVSVDYEAEDPFTLEGFQAPDKQQIFCLSNVLQTLGVNPSIRRRLMSPIWEDYNARTGERPSERE